MQIPDPGTKDYGTCLQPPDTRTARKVTNFQDLAVQKLFPMPISTPNTKESRETVPAEHLQLLVGCFILGLLLCSSLVAYTNHVKATITTLDQVSYSGSPASETMAPRTIRGPGTVEETTSIVQPKNMENSLEEEQTKTASETSNRELTVVDRFAEGSVSQKTGINKRLARKRISRTLAQTGIPTLSQAWSGTNIPIHAKAALIEMRREAPIRRQNAKEKLSRSGAIHRRLAIRTPLGP